MTKTRIDTAGAMSATMTVNGSDPTDALIRRVPVEAMEAEGTTGRATMADKAEKAHAAGMASMAQVAPMDVLILMIATTSNMGPAASGMRVPSAGQPEAITAADMDVNPTMKTGPVWSVIGTTE